MLGAAEHAKPDPGYDHLLVVEHGSSSLARLSGLQSGHVNHSTMRNHVQCSGNALSTASAGFSQSGVRINQGVRVTKLSPCDFRQLRLAVCRRNQSPIAAGYPHQGSGSSIDWILGLYSDRRKDTTQILGSYSFHSRGSRLAQPRGIGQDLVGPVDRGHRYGMSSCSAMPKTRIVDL